MSSEGNKIEESILPTITGDLSSIVESGSELAIDSLLNDGVLKDLPLVGSALALAKASFSVRNHLFLKKAVTFLGPISEAAREKRQKFANSLDTSAKRERFSETILGLIERADSRAKAKMYGIVFLTHINGEYEYNDVLKLCSMIERSFLPDLQQLPLFLNAQTDENLLTESLYKDGFLSIAGFDGGTIGAVPDDAGTFYKINWYGEQVVRLLQSELGEETT